MGATASPTAVWQRRRRGISRPRIAGSAFRRRFDAARPPDLARHGPLPVDGSSRRHAVSAEESTVEGTTDRVADDGEAAGFGDAQEQDAQPTRRAVWRCCARGRDETAKAISMRSEVFAGPPLLRLDPRGLQHRAPDPGM